MNALSRVKLPEDHSTSKKPAVDQFEDSEMIQMLVTVSDKTVSQEELERIRGRRSVARCGKICAGRMAWEITGSSIAAIFQYTI